jgi:hypothetical protein
MLLVPASFFLEMPKQVTSETSASEMPPNATFRLLFCRLTNTPIEKFQQALFRKGLYLHARVIAPLILHFRPEVFTEDFAAIQELADIRDPEVFSMEVSRFDGRNKRDCSWLRKVFLIRVSGKRLTLLKTKCFFG